jgi:hypothetical protein
MRLVNAKFPAKGSSVSASKIFNILELCTPCYVVFSNSASYHVYNFLLAEQIYPLRKAIRIFVTFFHFSLTKCVHIIIFFF